MASATPMLAALRRGALMAACVLLVPGCTSVEGGTSNALVIGGDDDGYNGVLLTKAYHVPRKDLTDTSGAKYSLATSVTADLTLVFFGYTSCPDICQIVMSTIASALNRLNPAQRARVDVVLVTTDPARDSAARLREYLDQFDPSFVGLRGSLKNIVAVAEPLGVSIGDAEQLPGGGYELSHDTPIVGIEPGARAPIAWLEPSPAQLAEDLQEYLGEVID